MTQTGFFSHFSGMGLHVIIFWTILPFGLFCPVNSFDRRQMIQNQENIETEEQNIKQPAAISPWFLPDRCDLVAPPIPRRRSCGGGATVRRPSTAPRRAGEEGRRRTPHSAASSPCGRRMAPPLQVPLQRVAVQVAPWPYLAFAGWSL